MTTVYLDGVGIEAPGLSTWENAVAILLGNNSYHFEKAPRPTATLIPENERRRACDTVHLAVHVAEQAVNHAQADPHTLMSVFGSFRGDLKVIHHLCSSLALPDHPVSPTQFHNSVFNSPAAHWSIATQSMGPSTSLCHAESSFAAALLSAVACSASENQGVLLVVYDVESPKPFHKQHAIDFNCGIALVLMPVKTGHSLAQLSVELRPHKSTERDIELNPDLKKLIKNNPSAQPLAILSAVAKKEKCEIPLPFSDTSTVAVEVQPCD